MSGSGAAASSGCHRCALPPVLYTLPLLHRCSHPFKTAGAGLCSVLKSCSGRGVPAKRRSSHCSRRLWPCKTRVTTGVCTGGESRLLLLLQLLCIAAMLQASVCFPAASFPSQQQRSPMPLRLCASPLGQVPGLH